MGNRNNEEYRGYNDPCFKVLEETENREEKNFKRAMTIIKAVLKRYGFKLMREVQVANRKSRKVYTLK